MFIQILVEEFEIQGQRSERRRGEKERRFLYSRRFIIIILKLVVSELLVIKGQLALGRYRVTMANENRIGFPNPGVPSFEPSFA